MASKSKAWSKSRTYPCLSKTKAKVSSGRGRHYICITSSFKTFNNYISLRTNDRFYCHSLYS